MSCGLITIGSTPDCDNIPVAGLSTRLILINYDDISAIYESDIGVVSIGMKDGKVGYEFFGFRNDVKKIEEVAQNASSKNRFKHALSFVIYEATQTQKLNIERLSRGRFVAIAEKKGKEADSFEMLGKECGLEMATGQIRTSDQAVFTINLSTPDNQVEFEPRLPQTVGETYSEGIDIIDVVLGETIADGGFDYELDLEVA